MPRRAKLLIAALVAAPIAAAGVAGAVEVVRVGTARRRGLLSTDDVPTPRPSVALAASVAVDTLITLPMPLLSSTGSARHYERSSAELDDAVRFYDDAGWLDAPLTRHEAPTECPDATIAPAEGRGRAVEVASFASGWEPQAGEPGGDRWRSFEANSIVPVRLLRHTGAPRPWLVAVHGQGMGRPGDVRSLRVRRMHDELGVNVALPILPLHGPRSASLAADAQFVSNVYPINNVLGLSQTVWDLRRLILWLRTEQLAPAVGVLGLSLGSYACSLLSTLERDLACVIAVVPTTDLADSLRAAEPIVPSRRKLHRDLYDERATLVHRVVSPVAGPCLVTRDRRFIVAGQVDRIAPPAGAAALWRHWEEPSIEWRPRGHVTTWQSTTYEHHVAAALTTSGLRAPSP